MVSTFKKNRRVLIAGIAFGAVFLSAACLHTRSDNLSVRPSDVSDSRRVSDDLGRTVAIARHIDRLVSLAPNLTEIVFAIGAGDRLVGDTEYCDYPPEAKGIAKVGDTLHPNIERLIALRPQLVLVSTSSQLESFVRQLNEQKIAVYVISAADLDGVFSSIVTVGGLLGKEKQAEDLVRSLKQRAQQVENSVRASNPVPVFYQLSPQPLYTAGKESFVTDLIRKAGGVSVTADVPGAWPRFSDESALSSRPQAIVIATSGPPEKDDTQIAAPLRTSPAVANGRVYRINGDYLSRPGPRLVDGLEQLARDLHPESFR